jgi:hypothetical protein
MERSEVEKRNLMEDVVLGPKQGGVGIEANAHEKHCRVRSVSTESGGGEEKIGARVAAREVFSYRTGRRPIGHPIDQVNYVAPLRFLPYRRKTREVQHGSRWAIDRNLVGGKGFSWACFSFSAISSLLLFFFSADLFPE